MASGDKLVSKMEDLTTDATPIPPAEVATPPLENVAIGDSLHNLSDGNESQESDEHGEPQELTTFHEEDHESREATKHEETDVLADLHNLSPEKLHGRNESKVSTNLIAKDKKSSSDRRLTKPDNSGLLKPGPPAVVYNITDASNVHVGPVVTVNLSSSSQAKSPQMAAPKKTKDISELLQSSIPVSEEDIDIVSPHVGHGWRKLGRQLKFTDGQLDQFEANFALEGRKEVIYQMLIDWKRVETDKATRGIMCSALWSAKQYDPVRILARRKVKTEA